jgi:signal transduction histidine kinase
MGSTASCGARKDFASPRNSTPTVGGAALSASTIVVIHTSSLRAVSITRGRVAKTCPRVIVASGQVRLPPAGIDLYPLASTRRPAQYSWIVRGLIGRVLVRVPRSGPSRVAFDLLVAVAALGLSTGLIALLDRVATSSSLGEVYLLAVVITAVVSGRVYAVAVSVVSVLLFDYLFLPPEYTLHLGNGDWLTLVVFLIVAFVITSLVASRERILTARDTERRRIERDLHDGAQQQLVALGMRLGAVDATLPNTLGEEKAELASIGQGLDSVLEELREISRGLHPAILSEAGLAPALRALARRSLVPVELDVHVDGRLPERIEITAYYIVAEALANAAKHAQATLVRVRMDPPGRVLRIVVADDGIGGADPSGSGLTGLSDRLAALNGRLLLQSPPGEGTTLVAELPVR